MAAGAFPTVAAVARACHSPSLQATDPARAAATGLAWVVHTCFGPEAGRTFRAAVLASVVSHTFEVAGRMPKVAAVAKACRSP